VSARALTVAKELARRVNQHDTLGSAAQLAYFLMLAFFPFLAALITLLAYLPVRPVFEQGLKRLEAVMPEQAMQVVHGYVDRLIGVQRPHLLTAGLLAALWTAAAGVSSLRTGLNRAYEVQESRSLARLTAQSWVMAAAGAVLGLLAVALFAVGGQTGEWLADELHMGHAWPETWSWLRWPLAALIIMLVASVAYHFLPDTSRPFKLVSWGSATGAVLWLLATWGFTQYVERFGKFDALYGSIGGVIVLMVWLNLSGLAFLLGGEIDAFVQQSKPRRPA
jgi:membrane protein